MMNEDQLLDVIMTMQEAIIILQKRMDKLESDVLSRQTQTRE